MSGSRVFLLEITMFRTALALSALVSFTSPLFAGQAVFEATGFVAGGSATSGPFVGTPVNAPVTLRFEVNLPGTIVTPTTKSYVVDTPTFLLTMGTASTGLNSTTATCNMRNNDPGVDGIYLGSTPLVGGGQLGFSFSSIGATMFNSTDPLTNIGTWVGGNFYSVFDFSVLGPGMFFDINFQTFSISLPTIGTPVCFGDGSSTACPCGNASLVGAAAGCLNSANLGGKLLAQGTASVSNDTVTLTASNITGPGLFFQSNGLSTPAVSFGDGLLCAGVGILRLGVVFPTSGTAVYPGGLTPNPITVGGAPISAGNTKHYQCWYRDAATFCTSATFNLTSALSLNWGA